MRTLLAFALVFVAFIATPSLRAQEPKIRDFDLKTIEKLGKELYERDHIASVGTDLMLEKHPEADQQPIRGWVSILGNEASTLYFVREKDGLLSLAYTVTFPRDGKPFVKDQIGEALPENVRLRYLAKKTAFAAVPKFYTPNPNGEVLDDPTGKGFLVYVLSSTTKPDEMVVGGHYRITVSADGKKAEAVDALSRSLLIISKNPSNLPKGSEPVAAFMSHIVSSTPVETHVFVSLLHHRPLFVSTSEKDIWQVENGTITKMPPPK
jgi:hypothetical protein